jgi:streptogramin lyase
MAGATPYITSYCRSGCSGVWASFVGTGIGDPKGVAYSPADGVWAASPGSNTIELLSFPRYYTGGGLDEPSALAVDISENVWIANQGGTQVSEWVQGTQSLTTPYSPAGAANATGIAIDAAGNVWLCYENGLTVFNPSSCTAAGCGSAYAEGEAIEPADLAIDGADNVWVAEDGGGAMDSGMLGGFSSTGSRITGGASGYGNSFSTSTELNFPSFLAIDGSEMCGYRTGATT